MLSGLLPNARVSSPYYIKCCHKKTHHYTGSFFLTEPNSVGIMPFQCVILVEMGPIQSNIGIWFRTRRNSLIGYWTDVNVPIQIPQPDIFKSP